MGQKVITKAIADYIWQRYSRLLELQQAGNFGLYLRGYAYRPDDIDERVSRFRNYVWDTYGAAPFSVCLLYLQGVRHGIVQEAQA